MICLLSARSCHRRFFLAFLIFLFFSCSKLVKTRFPIEVSKWTRLQLEAFYMRSEAYNCTFVQNSRNWWSKIMKTVPYLADKTLFGNCFVQPLISLQSSGRATNLSVIVVFDNSIGYRPFHKVLGFCILLHGDNIYIIVKDNKNIGYILTFCS